jgi:ornithine carbamoyltransferase
MEKDFIGIDGLTQQDLFDIFGLADTLQTATKSKTLDGRAVALIFQKPSLRTRVSFEVGVYQLGGHPIYLSQEGIGVGSREKASDIALLLSRYCSCIVARLFDHAILLDLAANASIPVINALTDLSHPCQIVADAYTLRQHKKFIKNFKIAFIGDGNNVANSWIELASIFPMHFVLAAPKGYEPNKTILEKSRKAGISTVEILHDPAQAARNADVIYTDVWTSMGQEGEEAKRKKDFSGFQVNETFMKMAKPDAVFMHCLPAHRGEEVSAEVLDGRQSVVFDQAENRLHVQKAILSKLVANGERNKRMNYPLDTTESFDFHE